MYKKIFDEWVKVPLIITMWAIILIGMLALGQVIGETNANELEYEQIESLIIQETSNLHIDIQMQKAEIDDLKEQLKKEQQKQESIETSYYTAFENNKEKLENN